MHEEFREMLRDVRAIALANKPGSFRAQTPTTVSRQSTGVDGGFAVDADSAKSIMQVIRERSIIGRCSILPTEKGEVVVPADETPPWKATGVYWASEIQTLEQSKGEFQGRFLRLNKIIALVPVSEELLEDSDLFDAWVRTALPARIAAKLQTAIVRGTGVGQVEGMLNAACALNIARTTAGQVKAEDFAAMFARLHGEGRNRAVWLANADVTVPTTPGLPLLMHGQEVEWLEACSAIGTRGDLILADLDAFLLAMQGLRVDRSIHVFFDVHASAYRFVLRVTGSPTWSKAYAGENSTTTRSPAIILSDAA